MISMFDDLQSALVASSKLNWRIANLKGNGLVVRFEGGHASPFSMHESGFPRTSAIALWNILADTTILTSQA